MKKQIAISATILAMVLTLALLAVPQSPLLTVHLAYADALDNDINAIYIYQPIDTALDTQVATNQSYRIVGAVNMSFIVEIQLNDTLAVSTGEAISYTKVTMNITEGVNAILTNEELTNINCTHLGDYYILYETTQWVSSLPEDGKTYVCAIKYEAYY